MVHSADTLLKGADSSVVHGAVKGIITEPVDILEGDEKRLMSEGNGNFVIDAIWVVGGSVNHFGHTHYRRNRYHAQILFVTIDDFWKIKDIELIDEKRLLQL